jgi:hypothetical protein
MGRFDIRHYLRLDTATDQALEQMCRATFMTKSALMRHYVKQGVAKDVTRTADQIKNTTVSTDFLAEHLPTRSYPKPHIHRGDD